MRKHPTRKRLNELFNYREDGHLIWKTMTSNNIKVGDIAGDFNNYGYRRVSVDNVRYLSHRLIWILCNGYNPENDIDHINRNKSDNRIENLREVTRQCNLRNSGNRNDNTSGVKGVSWDNSENKWNTKIGVDGRRINLGYYDDFSDAVLIRLEVEQCLDWDGCDSSSSAYQYAIKHKLIKR